jgi:dolichol-phosphate mannosyltransferase
MKLISIIIPAYNEEKNIPLIHDALANVFNTYDGRYSFEIIFINDGSSDDTWDRIVGLAKTDNRVKGICFSRNFGHQPAIEAGLESAKGDAVIMMDADMQHPPELIPQMIEKWESGFCVVNTIRTETEKETILNQLNKGSADFRLIDRKAVSELLKLTEKDKFYRGLIQWIGFSEVSVEYVARQREHGTTSYTLKRMLSFARIGITSFSLLPMKLIMIFGGLVFLIGSIMLTIMLYFRWFIDDGFFSGNAILAVIVLISNGFIITVVGILSVYQMTMFRELKNRPNFIIEQMIGYGE